jgi:hypothetical protein
VDESFSLSVMLFAFLFTRFAGGWRLGFDLARVERELRVVAIIYTHGLKQWQNSIFDIPCASLQAS